MILGCIGDDFTGSSDLANTLAKGGMRVVQFSGVPSAPADAGVEAGVVALKSRSIAPDEAVRQSLEALAWLKEQGCTQFFFKYCSTFDSTPQGNIGPVIEALANDLDADRIVVCPAFPTAGRTLYQGHLFVSDKLLSSSGMENHPLTPMTDPDIRRWLQRQTGLEVGHIPATTVFAGADAIRRGLEAQSENGRRVVVVDAIRDADLVNIGTATAGLPLVTGGSGVALGLPANFARNGQISGVRPRWRGETGKCIALSGSCSNMTRAQIARHRETEVCLPIDASAVVEGKVDPRALAEDLVQAPGLPLAFSSADPAEVSRIQKEYGREKSAAALEDFFAEVARALVERGVRKILTAGGETSGAVVEGLAIDQFEIGPEIAPGVPALRAGLELVVALKSGNFGAEDYFAKAGAVLGSSD